MNVWFQDPRVEQAEVDAFEAERAEKRGQTTEARALYRRAAHGLATVALTVSPDHPNTRSDLSIAAVASYGRAGCFGEATSFARRMLAETDALTDSGRAELKRLLREYDALSPLHRGPNRGDAVRAQVRGAFRKAAA